MNTNSIQQEILLIANSSFSKRGLVDKDATGNNKNASQAEQLIAACWNGWLSETLPEMMDTTTDGSNLYMWDIMQARFFIDIELCERPQTIDTYFSVNPYVFLTSLCYE